MSNYCKAYLAGRLREFEGWTENAANASPAASSESEAGTQTPRELTDNCILYLHDNLVVTDGIYVDEHVIFSDVSPEWRRFCTDRLQFEVPEESCDPAGGYEGTAASTVAQDG